jgi:xanthine dehydrogenase accessory factor
MRELDLIQQRLAEARDRHEAVMLATIVSVTGSVYRGTGARMLVTANGDSVGAVSGGCLEADVIARAPDVLAAGQVELIRYDTRASDDAILGLGLGCQGVIELLVEPLAGPKLDDAVAFYRRLASHHEPVCLLTRVVAGDREKSCERVVTTLDGQVLEGRSPDGDIMASNSPGVVREVVQPAVRLLVCGAGADAIPVCRMAALVGFHCSVTDHRAIFLTSSRFPDAIALSKCEFGEDGEARLDDDLLIDRRTMAIVMAHSAAHDRAYLHVLLRAGVHYIGVLGPRRRTLELLGDGLIPARELPPTVYSPVGLDLGAETPEEIALAIVSEVAAVASGRNGGMLRDGTGPIHGDRSGARAEE